MRSVRRVDTAVTRLHMLICCTCGSGIGRLWWSELPPTHFHPIPFIPTECGSPFTLLSQKREGRRGKGKVEGGGGGEGERGGGGGGKVVSEGERWSPSSPWLREKEKQLVCKWMPLPYSWMTQPSLPPFPPFCSFWMLRKRSTVKTGAIG